MPKNKKTVLIVALICLIGLNIALFSTNSLKDLQNDRSFNPDKYFQFKDYKLDNQIKILDNKDLSIYATGYSVGYELYYENMEDPHAIQIHMKVKNKEDKDRSYYIDYNKPGWFENKNGEYLLSPQYGAMKPSLVIGSNKEDETYFIMHDMDDNMINHVLKSASTLKYNFAVRDAQTKEILKSYPIEVDIKSLFKNSEEV